MAMAMKENKESGTGDQTTTILTLLRRGETVDQISTLLHVRETDVERVLDWYVDRMMA